MYRNQISQLEAEDLGIEGELGLQRSLLIGRHAEAVALALEDLGSRPLGQGAGELARGRIALGVTGSDVVREKIAGWERKLTPLAPLGFGHADLVLAVPKTWTDVTNLGDLDAVADAFWKEHGFRLRIATKYPNVTRRHFAARGVHAEVIKLYGAMELAPILGLADEIVDIVDTGNTLKANGLEARELIEHISSRLVVNRASMKMKHGAVNQLIEELRGAVERLS